VRTQQGTINANGLEVTKAGEIVRFNGGVLVDLPAGMTDLGGPPADKP
jgi:hypothetical protein